MDPVALQFIEVLAWRRRQSTKRTEDRRFCESLAFYGMLAHRTPWSDFLKRSLLTRSSETETHTPRTSRCCTEDGALTLTPLYDLMCTLYYGDDRLAMCIDNVRRTNLLTMERIVNEAVRWGMSRGRATEIVVNLLERAPAALGLAREVTEGVPAKLVTIVKAQLKQLRSVE